MGLFGKKTRKIDYARGDYDRSYHNTQEWLEFVESMRKLRWEAECQNKQEIIHIVDGDMEIAIAVFAIAGQDSVEWVRRNGGVKLGFLSPKECLEMGLRGRLQAALISFPYI